MEKLLEECVSYFKGNKAYRRIFDKIKEKYISIGTFSGTIKLENISEDEKKALIDLLGQKFYLNKTRTIKVNDIVESLKYTKFEGVDFYAMLCKYFGERIIINKDIKETNRLKKDNFFNNLKSSVDLNVYCFITDTFENKVSGCYNLLINKYNEDSTGEKLLKELICLNNICHKLNSKSMLRIAILASEVTSNPHALDEDTFLNKILTYYICEKNSTKLPKNAEEKNTLFYENNILKDDISNNTLVAGIFAYTLQNTNLAECKGWNSLALEYEPIVLSLVNLNKISALMPMNNKVIIVENPTVFMKMHEVISCNKDRCTLICSNGQINLSTLMILDLLSKNDCMFYYSGDYDPEGLLITDKLLQRYKDKIEPLFYSEDIYMSIISNKKIDDRRLKQLDRIIDNRLISIAETMRKEKRAAYQEMLDFNLLMKN
ncbi:MAG: TIGR02679 domain-containing protein [Vulcanibacillus sp.]